MASRARRRNVVVNFMVVVDTVDGIGLGCFWFIRSGNCAVRQFGYGITEDRLNNVFVNVQ
jgi:hypothetical protein